MTEKETVSIHISQSNYCPIHKHKIDDKLVNKIKPDCIKKNNGCGNCPEIEVRIETTEVRSKPVYEEAKVQ